MGQPSDVQLAQIKSYLQSTDSSEAADWFVFSALASDNLVSRSYRKWTINVLQQMAEALKGKPLIADHEWDESEEVLGFIFDANLIKLATPIMAAVNQPLKTDFNKQIVASEGQYVLICSIAVPAGDVEFINAVKARKYQAVSTGGYLQGIKMICPNCSTKHNRQVSFTERDMEGSYLCPHLIPSDLSYGMDDDDDDDDDCVSVQYADYLELDGIFDGIELSAVVAGNLPYAQIVR